MSGVMKNRFFTSQVSRACSIALLVVGLMGCSLWGGAEKSKPVELGVNIPLLGVRQAWIAQLGSDVGAQLLPHVQNSTVTFASSSGVVVAIDARTGSDVWRLNLREPLVAGVGSDGLRAAVVSRGNELIVLEGGREQWRQRLAAQVYTSPFVAGGRVFILASDRTVMAFDVVNGHRLWSQSRPGESLILRQSGVLFAVGDTLLAGVSGRLVGLNPDNGAGKWEASLATPRGTNDVERLVELVGPVSRVGESVCVRAFQSTVGCVDATSQAVKWIRKSNGFEGLGGDELAVYGTQSNGTVAAWNRNDGSPIWLSERLQYRKLTAPLQLGRSVVVGDESGLVHFLSREDGSPLNRLTTDGTGIDIAPVSAADTLIVVTRKGNIYGFRPD